MEPLPSLVPAPVIIGATVVLVMAALILSVLGTVKWIREQRAQVRFVAPAENTEGEG
jgi:hypothetical protein